MKIELNKVYRSTNGTEWKIVCSTELGNYFAVDKNQKNFTCFTSDGEHRDIINKHEYDLFETVDNNNKISFELKHIFTNRIDNRLCYMLEYCVKKLIEEHPEIKFSNRRWKITFQEDNE